MAIVDRIKGICLKPKDEWQVIEGESTPVADLLKNYALPLAAIGAIAGFIGISIIGVSTPYSSFRLPFATGLIAGIVRLALSLVMVYVLALIIDALAPQFGAQKNKAQAFKVAVYSFTPGWIAGILGLIPSALLGLVALAALGYGVYLLHLGLLQLMKPPKEKAVTYTVVVVLCGVGLAIVQGLIASAITAPAMLAAMPGMH
jgi:hypothetical protein